MQTILVLPNVADNQEIKVKKVQEVEKVIEVRNLKSWKILEVEEV